MNQFLTDIQKRRLFNTVFILLILLAVFIGAEALNALKENDYIGRSINATNTITVNGTGEVFAIPDTGSLSFSVVEDGKTVAEAQNKASKKINLILDAVKGMGVAEKDIKTLGYNSSPKYEYQTNQICTSGYCPPGKQVLVGYEVNQTIGVKIRKTADSGAVLTRIGSLEASNISGLDFVIDDMDAVTKEARDKAIQDAKDKAKVLAKSLGVRLNKIISFSESNNRPIYYGMMAEVKGMGAGDVATPPQTPVGENQVVSNVSITYEVE